MLMIFRTLTILVAAAGLGSATITENNVNNNTFNWTTHLTRGQLIEIKGINGSIRAEGTDGDDVEVIAEKSGRRFDPADVEIAVVDNGNGSTVCAVYPSKHGISPRTSSDCRPGSGGRLSTGNNDVKVEFTVRVPNGVRFIGRTVNGSIQAVHLGADVEARTVNGKINVTTTGTALAETVNGSIHAALGSAAGDTARKFRTVNGSIELELSGDVNAAFAASTVNGHIDSDFPITMHGHFMNRHVHGTVGCGGQELRISTVNGSITLRDSRALTI